MKAMKLIFVFTIALTTLTGQADAQLIEASYSRNDLTLVLGDAGHSCDVTYVDNRIVVQVFRSERDPVSGLQQEVYLRMFRWAALENLTVKMGAGDDVFTIEDFIPVRCVVHGGDGDDAILGGMMGDELLGEGGKDIINGAGGDDFLFTGDEGIGEIMLGGEGNDFFFIPTYCWNRSFGSADKSASKLDGKFDGDTDKKSSEPSKKDLSKVQKDGFGFGFELADLREPDAEDLLSGQESWTDRNVSDLGRPSSRPRLICIEKEEDWAIDFELGEDRKVFVPRN